jgi:polyphosphate kinase
MSQERPTFPLAAVNGDYVVKCCAHRFKLLPVDIYEMSDEVTIHRSLKWPAYRFAAIQAEDWMVHHHFDSFDDRVAHFIWEAAGDPQAVASKMTAYRIRDDTPFVRSLINAAESGKQVACVIEIKARFDEDAICYGLLSWSEFRRAPRFLL